MRKSLIFLFLLFCAPAGAQNVGPPYFPQTLPSGTVVGRTQAGTGPASAITYAQIISQFWPSPAQYNVLTFGATTSGWGQVNLGQSAAVTGQLPNGNIANPQTTVAGQTCTLGSTCGLSAMNNAISIDVTMSSQFTFYDGPSVAQGSTGTWFACGTITLVDSSGAAAFIAKLYDGTTTISITEQYQAGTGVDTAITLCGYIASPAGNIRMAGYNQSSTHGTIKASTTDGALPGASKIWAIRIQ